MWIAIPVIASCSSSMTDTPMGENETSIQPNEVSMPEQVSNDRIASTGANTARDGNVAIIEEFEHFKSKGTIEAMELFIARHPDHVLVKDARTYINQLKLNQPKQE